MLNRIKRGVIYLLPAVLFFSFYYFQATDSSKSVFPHEGRKIIWIIVSILCISHLFLHNNFLKAVVYYSVFNLFFVKSNSFSLSYLMVVWCVCMFSSFVYRLNRSYRFWVCVLLSIYLWSFYSILASNFGLPNHYHILSNVRHLHFPQYTGAFTHTAHQGIYSAMMIPISFLINPLFIIPQILTLFLSRISIAVFAVLVVCELYLFRKNFYLFVFSVPFISFAFYFYNFYYDSNSAFSFVYSARVEFWRKLIKLTGFNLFGNGLGSFRYIRGVTGDPLSIYAGIYANAHNFLVQWYYEVGFAGLIIFLFYPARIFFKYIFSPCSKAEHCLFASCLISVICALWQPSFSVVEIGIPTVVLLTLLERRLKNGKV